jgi:predicted metal-binding protein
MSGERGRSATTLTVCRTCRPEGCAADAEPPGAALGRAAAEAVRRLGPDAQIEVRAIPCLSACGRACSASISAAEKFSYVIGGLTPEDAGDLVAFARAHAESSDGVPPWRARPEKIRKNTVARVPPAGCGHALVEEIREAEDVIPGR